MELKQIKELIAAMGRSDLKELFLKKGDFELRLERGAPVPYYREEFVDADNFAPVQEGFYQRSPRTLSKGLADIPSSLQSPLSEEPKKEAATGTFVKSPMVGTYYSSPAPEEPPFVKVGDVISKDTVICIIEAMKVMNEVKAGVSGVVVEILVDNGQPVEFGTHLIKIS